MKFPPKELDAFLPPLGFMARVKAQGAWERRRS